MKIAVAIPTRGRAGYLDVTLASVMPQAQDAEVIVVDDGPDEQTRSVAERHGATYLVNPGSGPSAARNAALDATDAELVCYLDDDVRVDPGWLAALAHAAGELPDEVGCLTGPVRARIEDHRFRSCGRENLPISHMDLGAEDTDTPQAWGANMAIRRSAFDRVGRFAEHHQHYGEEDEWQRRLRAAGGRIRYVAAAGLDHRRAGDDARLRSLMRAQRARGQAARREDVLKGVIPSLRSELKTLALCVAHGPRHLCMSGPVLAAHAFGRVEETLDPTPPPATPGVDDFLSGQSGTFGGWRGRLAGVADALLDLRDRPRAARLARRARGVTPQRVLVLAVARPGSRFPAAQAELMDSRHHVTVATTGTNDRGKFANLNALLAEQEHELADSDWLLVVDDDITLPRHFLDAFLFAASGAQLAQPAHRRRSHAAWRHTRRRTTLGAPAARPTTFVEIGPLTAFHRSTFATLLPFPDLEMGWGLDAHWSALARDRGWRMVIVDAVPIGHADRPAGDAYSRERVIAEARAFLADRPYVRRDEAR